MPIIPIPFGEGLQRADGIMVVKPTTFADLRNVYQYEGKAQARGGLTETDRLVDDLAADLDMTLALGPLRAENAAIGVGFDNVSKELWVNRLTINGTNASNIGLFGTLSGAATYDPPIIILADSDNKGFIAHDEPNINARISTKYYDPLAFPQVVTLQADLDGNGLADVYFRGVVRHLSYIFGWGYGSASEPDRIDVVRVSTGGNPTIFRDDAFFEAGQRGEPIMCCRPAGNFLMVFKETETYQIFGYSPDTFGIRPADTLFGCVSSRLAVSIAGTVFFWSVQGPRVTTGGESQDIAVPLDLDGPDPATLVAEADVQNAFAEYDPATRVVNFVWGRRVYALSIRNPNKPRWSYYELGETAQCGAQFFSTQSTAGGGGQPADGPIFDVGSPFPTITETTIEVNWDNIGATGGEAIEVWARVSPAGGWSQVGEALYNGLPDQTLTITGLSPNTTYDFALRYRRGGLYNPSATSADPTTWPAGAQDQAMTLIGLPQPILRGANNGRWQVAAGPSESIRIQWTIPFGHEGLQIEIERAIQTEGNPTTQDLDGIGIGPPDTNRTTVSAFAPLVTLPAGTTEYVDTAITPHRWHVYRMRFVGGTPYTANIDCWAGPDAQNADWSAEADPLAVSASFFYATTPTGRTQCPGPSNPPSGHNSFMYAVNITDNPASNTWTRGTGLPGGPFDTVCGHDAVPSADVGDTIRCGIRHEVTCHGTVYPSHWAPITATPNVRDVVVEDFE